VHSADRETRLENGVSRFLVTPFFLRPQKTRTPHSSKKIRNNNNNMLVGSTRPRVVEYCLGTLQAHLQNKCVITKYDYCGWHGCRVPTIPLRPHPRGYCLLLYIGHLPSSASYPRHPFHVPSALCGYACGYNGGGPRICSGHSAECNFTKQYITTLTLYPLHPPPTRLVCQYMTIQQSSFQPVLLLFFSLSDFRNPLNGWPL